MLTFEVSIHIARTPSKLATNASFGAAHHLSLWGPWSPGIGDSARRPLAVGFAAVKERIMVPAQAFSQQTATRRIRKAAENWTSYRLSEGVSTARQLAARLGLTVLNVTSDDVLARQVQMPYADPERLGQLHDLVLRRLSGAADDADRKSPGSWAVSRMVASAA